MGILILCIKIFFVRLIDVSLGTVRSIVIVKERVLLASFVGFLEVFVWFMVAKEALNTSETSIWIAVFYSLGFATGTYIGGKISERFIKGTLSVQIITSNKNNYVISILKEKGYGVSVMDVRGGYNESDKYLLFIEIDKNKLEKLKSLIHKLDDKAFIVVNETKYVQNGFFGVEKSK